MTSYVVGQNFENSTASLNRFGTLDQICGDSVQGNIITNSSYTTNSCFCRPFGLSGCTDATADNYESSASLDDGSCVHTISGCIDVSASNYDSNANSNDGSCQYDSSGSTSSVLLSLIHI